MEISNWNLMYEKIICRETKIFVSNFLESMKNKISIPKNILKYLNLENQKIFDNYKGIVKFYDEVKKTSVEWKQFNPKKDNRMFVKDFIVLIDSSIQAIQVIKESLNQAGLENAEIINEKQVSIILETGVQILSTRINMFYTRYSVLKKENAKIPDIFKESFDVINDMAKRDSVINSNEFLKYGFKYVLCYLKTRDWLFKNEIENERKILFDTSQLLWELMGGYYIISLMLIINLDFQLMNNIISNEIYVVSKPKLNLF